MLSRRSVRVKVIQLLYSASRDEALTLSDVVKRYKTSIENSFELFLFSLFSISEVTSVAVEDMDKRKSKYLPSDVDKSFDARLYLNPKIASIQTNQILQKEFDRFHFRTKTDKDVFRTIYNEFQKEEAYNTYISQESVSDDEHLEMLLELFRFCRQNNSFNELIEDQYVTWEDDKSLVIGSIKKVLKGLPFDKGDFFKEFFPEDEMVKDFGELLLKRTFEDDATLLDHISPLLKNWHHDRVAILDMIMIKMALVEFMHCDSVPVKVTINEYVEISKLYSTSKSKDFINGLLEALKNSFKESGKINKSGRGLEE